MDGTHFRWKYILAATLIVLPLLVTIVLQFRSARQEAAATTAISSVVVIPADFIGAPEQSYLNDAVAGTLTAYLMGVPELDTKVPPSRSDFMRIGGDYNRITTAYGVDALVVVTVTADGSLYMISLQIADSRSQRVFWKSEYQGPRDKYLQLIQAAGEGLRRAIRPQTERLNFTKGVSADSEAELAFREGESYRSRNEFPEALAAFKRALALDPSLVNAAAEIARLYATGTLENPSEAKRWARLALQLDARCGRAYVALAELEQLEPQPDPKRGLANAIRGASLDPKYPDAHKLLAALLPGSLGEAARKEWRRLAPLQPDAAISATPAAGENISRTLDEARARGELPEYLRSIK